MNLPVANPTVLLALGLLFGIAFGWLLHRGGVTNYNVIVNQFRLRDWTVFRIMFTAILVGGVGVLLMKRADVAVYHVKEANLLGVGLGAALFGIGMVVYGYCPGTGVAAVATGSLHALVGFAGMIAGGILYGLSFSWVRQNILSVGAWGKVRLPDTLGLPDIAWFAILAGVAVIVLALVPRLERPAAASHKQSEPAHR